MDKNYRTALEKLNKNQRLAVETLDGPLLVLAGPGTGKTQLLSTRVAHILATTDTNPENVLCLTFTDSGAANMRTRLSSLIGRPAAKVHISTYHAFGRTILGAYANYAEKPPRLFENPISNVESHNIFAEILRTLPTNDILKSAKIADLIAVTKELKSARLTPSDVKKIAEYNLNASEGLNSEISPLLERLVPRKFTENIPIYEEILKVLTKYISKKPITKDIEPEANFLARDLRNILDEATKITPLTKWKTANFERDEAGNYRLKNLIANKKLLSLANVLEKYQTTLESENLFDYADMIEQAIAYLKSDPGFRATMSETYEFILLDEFQDTNPSQFDLVKLLTGYEKPNVMAVGDDDQAIMEFQGANASNLLDFENHYKASVITLTENYRSTQPILDLSRKIANQIEDSFSKAHGVNKELHSNYKQFSSSDSLRAENHTQAERKRGECVPSLSTIERHEFIASPSEYDWIAGDIESRIAAGEDPASIAIITPKHKYIGSLLPHLAARNLPISYERKENIFEDPRINQLLLLARFVYQLADGRQAAHLLPELLSAPYWALDPVTVVESLNAARTEKQNALTYLKNSDDTRLSTLATFFANLATHSFDTPLDLFLDYLIGSAPLEGYRSPFLAYYTSEMGADETRGRGRADDCPPSTYPTPSGRNFCNTPSLVDEPTRLVTGSASKQTDGALQKSHREGGACEEGSRLLCPALSSGYDTFTLYENLSVLKQALVSYAKTETPRLRNLIKMLNDYDSAGEPLNNTSPYQTSNEAIQIMSAHKAKGLEFSCVYLISVDDAAWGNAGGNNSTFTLPKNLAHVRHTGITEDERLRLFFVAITRAKTHLYMTNSKSDFAGKTPAPLEYLEETDGLSPLLPAESQKIIVHGSIAKDPKPLKTHWSTTLLSHQADLAPILKKRLENYRLTPTDLTAYIDLVYAGPTYLYLKFIGAPGEPASARQAYGNYIHSVLDFATKNKTTDDKALMDLYDTLVKNSDFPEEEKADLLEKGTTNLPQILKKLGGHLRAENSISEIDFYPDHLAINGVPITGKIDLALINKEAKTITVIDYKTNSYDPKKSWANNSTLYKYRLQLGFYKLLLNNSPKYKNYRVETALLEHLEPTPEGKLFSRPYTYPAADEEELLALVSAVYHNIKSLTFPPLPPDPDKTLKDIKSFVATLLA